ncbi:MAG: 16S rRNA (uracil(1498)-N(3))-methyltransferase [Planctomycetes bacterium]|nr:16S rRNA (uracil(1498)-N(3))-methyltransferase [Planctomycetota bacterium]
MAQRYFVDTLPAPGEFRLGGELAHHLGTVLRSKAGDQVRLADGRGRSAPAGIVAIGKREIVLEVGPGEFAAAPNRRVHLAFAPPRKQRADWLFEHGTEVGVAVFWPLWTARTRPQGEKPERWQRLARAAAGQCDRDWLPEIRPALEFDAFVAHPDLPVRRLLADREGPGLPAGAAADAGEVLLLVGPEGGFSRPETELARNAGFEPIRLGPHILRTETAALLGAGLLMASS